jgi:hypothetical protein
MAATFPDMPQHERRDRAPEWARWAAVGCGVLVLGLAALLVWSAVRADGLVNWGLRRLVARVTATLPDGVPQPARDELQRKLDCALQAAADHRVPPSRIGELARACTDALADKQVSMTELEEIDRIAGSLCAQGQTQTGAEAPQ